jgi:formylglycine-generating enzyme required for sulfatase activity
MDSVSRGSANPIYADLEIRILARETPGYPVEISVPGEQEFPRGYLRPEFLPWVPSASPGDDGRRLFNWLLADDRLKKAWAEARGRHPQRRVRLRLDPTAPELHTLPWELLREAGDETAPQDLAAGVATPFSRYLAGRQLRARPVAKRPIKVLVAIAAPENLAEFGLAPIEPEAEWSLLQEATADLEIELVALPQPCTLSAIEAGLKEGFHILHLVGHGQYSDGKGQAKLYLADGDNRVALVGERDFAAMLGRQWSEAQARQDDGLRLVFLASCQTASISSADAFRGFGPALIQHGVPAVVAMQDLIPVETARVFSQVFYRQLLAHGLVDLAGNEARSALLTAKLPGSSIPVLYSRLYDNRLFLQPGNIINLPPAPQDIVSQPDREAEVEAEASPDNPYRGLFAFRPEHAHLFFGRETFTEKLVEATESRSLVAVLGASGSGKSSVVFAGLVPALRQRPNEQWLITTFRPGQDPFLGLANALVPLLEPDLNKIQGGRAAYELATNLREGRPPLGNYLNLIWQSQPEHRLLLIADQFEELYTLCRDPHIRQQFLDLLLDTLGTGHDTWLRLVLTLRADFLGQALTHRPFADALQEADLKLGPMNRAELTAAVEKPAELQGVRFEEKLVERILDDVGQEEGGLPLLEFALTELWGHQSERRLTYVAYEAIGGVKGALSRHADKVYGRLSPEDQEQARRVFVQLVNPGAGTEDTRLVARQTHLAADWSLVARLANERLVVTSVTEDRQDTVEVVHEALISHWPKLRAWMEADREFLTWRLGLRADLERWQETSRDEGALLRGAPLAVAQEKMQERPDDLNAAERDFIEASLARQKKQEQQRRMLLAGVVVAAIVMTVLAIVSFIQFQNAQSAKNEAIAEQNKAAVAEANAVIDRDKAATSEAVALTAEADAVSAARALAEENEKAQAELNFYQTTDPAERLKELHNLFSRPEADSWARARSLFFGLPRVDQLALLRVAEKPDGLPTVGRAILPNLADINGIYYTDQHLTALLESVAEGSLQTELAGWLAAREAAQDEAYDEALAQYDELLQADEQNPALWYERARVRAKLGQAAEALADLARVTELAQAPEYAPSGVLLVGPEFATTDQMVEAVRRLMMVYPKVADAFEAAADYPALAEVTLTLPTVITDSKGVPMVQVPAGWFKMGNNAGDSNEQPVHEIYLDEYYIDQYEVTNEQFVAFLNDQGNREEGGRNWYDPTYGQIEERDERWQVAPPGLFEQRSEQHPVTGVSWYGAQAYCAWRGGHLPTEAQWEKAARGDDERTYPWGEEIASHLARYYNSGGGGIAPVGHYPEGVSPYGAYDMAGNVWEWVADAYDSEYYQHSPARNPTGPADEQNISSKVLRGGSWDSLVNNSRASYRLFGAPYNQRVGLGLRCVGSAAE